MGQIFHAALASEVAVRYRSAFFAVVILGVFVDFSHP
jgi:hypothetical protein